MTINGIECKVTVIGDSNHKTLFQGKKIATLTIPTSVSTLTNANLNEATSIAKVIFKGKRPTSFDTSKKLPTGTPVYYTVTFKNGDNIVQTSEVKSGETVTPPANPTGEDRDGLYRVWDTLLCQDIENSVEITTAWGDASGLVYSLKTSGSKNSATVIGINDKFTSGQDLSIPDKITLDGVDYDVTMIGDLTHTTIFQGKEIQKLTIPSTVTNMAKAGFTNGVYGSVVFKGKRPTSVKPDTAFPTGTSIYYTINFTDAGTVVKSQEVLAGGSATPPQSISSREGLSYTWEGDGYQNIDNSGTVYAQWSDTSGIIYDLDDGAKTAEVAGATNSLSGKVDIPSSIDGHAVTSIAKGAFEDNQQIAEVTIPSSVEKMGFNIFEGCTNLKKAFLSNPRAFPDSASAAPSYLFKGCTALTDVTLPEGMLRITASCFEGCTGLTAVSIPASVKTIAGSAFSGCSAIESLQLPEGISFVTGTNSSTGKDTVASKTFENMTGLKEITLPDSVKAIGSNMFAGCTSLSKVEMGDVTSIGDQAFQGCAALTSLELKEGLESLGTGALANSGISDITLPSTLATVGQYLFASNKGKDENASLKSVTVKKSDGFEDSVGIFAGCTSLATVKLDDDIATLPNYCFSGCTSLEAVKLPQSLGIISEYAFQSCSSLTGLDIPASVTQIQSSAFYGAGLKSLVIPASVTMLGKGTSTGVISLFADCEQLEDVRIYAKGENDITIATNSFSNCNRLKNVVLGSGITKLGKNAFSGASVNTLTVTDKLASVDKTAFSALGNSDPAIVKTVVFAGGMNTALSKDDFPQTSTLVNVSLDEQNKTATIDSVTSSLAGDYELPGSVDVDGTEYKVTTIGSKVLAGAPNITSVKIPSGVTNIAEDAFGEGVAQKMAVRFFDRDGAQIGETQYVEKGMAAEAPQAPEIEGYGFTGWSVDTSSVSLPTDATALYEAKAVDPEPTTPATPETPETPETPSTPATPATPETPATPATPETPETPSAPATPETSETPETPADTGNATDGNTNASTGDNANAGNADANAGSGASTSTNTGASAGTSGAALSAGGTARTAAGSATVTVRAASDGTVSVTAAAAKSGSSVTVNSVTVGGRTYKVASIAANAFKGTKAKSITVGSNVKTIGAGAFSGSKRLTSLTIGKNVKSVGKNVLRGSKKVKTITVKTKKLTKKSIKNMLKGSSVKTVKVKVGSKAQNKKFVKKYKKIFTKKVCGKAVKVK